jgi:hypothetical protein
MNTIRFVFLQSMIKEPNLSRYSFNVAIVDFSYTFQLLQSKYRQTVHQKCKTGIILHIISG